MGGYVTVSAKVRRELREEAERLGINVSELLRRSLEEEVKRMKVELLKRRIEGLRGVLEKIDMDRVVRGIREDRESE